VIATAGFAFTAGVIISLDFSNSVGLANLADQITFTHDINTALNNLLTNLHTYRDIYDELTYTHIIQRHYRRF
jgi:hypothetical protein